MRGEETSSSAEQLVSLTAQPAAKPTTRRQAQEFRLGPRSAPEVVDLGVEVLMSRFLLCVGLGVLLWFPLRALAPFVLRAAPATGFDETQVYTFFLALGGYSILTQLVSIVATVALTLISYHALLGRELGAREALGKTLRRSFALLGLFLLQFLIVSAGTFLLLGLGAFCPPLWLGALAFWLYFSWKLSVAPSALVLEELSVTAALSRSFSLTEGSFLRWLGVVTISGLLVAPLGGGAQLSDNVALREVLLAELPISPMLFDVSFVFISSVFAGLSTAVLAVVMTSYYLDTRIRREGLDLRMRLERLARVGAPEPRA
jgi:hypothetical protein